MVFRMDMATAIVLIKVEELSSDGHKKGRKTFRPSLRHYQAMGLELVHRVVFA